jgi:hypothetical protein
MDKNNFNDIKIPEIYKNKWLKFDNTIYYPIEINDCNDTINGICFQNLSFEQCVNKCVGDCNMGYFINTGNNTICVPIRSQAYKSANPSYRLRNQNIYDLNKDVKITTFQNKNLYPYPPEKTISNIKYETIVQINSYINQDLSITVDTTKNNSDIRMTTIGTNINFLPRYISSFLISYETIPFNHYIFFQIPSTTLMLEDNNNNLSFKIIDSNLGLDNIEKNISNNLFAFEPKDNDKNTNIKWYEPVYIKAYNNKYLWINSQNIVVLSSKNKSLFFLKPQIIPYYCENNKCISGNIDNITKDANNNLKIKNSKGELKNIYYNNNCWNQCKTNYTSSNNINSNSNITNKMIMIIISLLLIILFIFIFKKFY